MFWNFLVGLLVALTLVLLLCAGLVLYFALPLTEIFNRWLTGNPEPESAGIGRSMRPGPPPVHALFDQGAQLRPLFGAQTVAEFGELVHQLPAPAALAPGEVALLQQCACLVPIKMGGIEQF